MKLSKSILNCTIVLSIIVTLFAALPASTALAFTVGPFDPALATNLASTGTEPWQNPENIQTPGDPYATLLLYHDHQYSNYLQGIQYDFSAIPDDATIMGIEVNINRMYSGHAGVRDIIVSLVKAGVISGTNKAAIVDWPSSFETATYGGPTDLWENEWTPADIKSLDFGVVLAAFRGNNGQPSTTAYVDTMQITVYYGYATTTAVDCGNGTPETVYGDSITCVATVTRVGGDQTPTGTVGWTTDGSGLLDPNPCTLTGADGTATCAVTYTPDAVGTGSHLLTGTYSGDDYFASSSASEPVTVTQRLVTVAADPLTKAYGDPDPAFTYQITQGSLVFSDTFTGTLTREPGEAVGTYPILQGSLALTDNYVLTYVGADLTITLRPITVTVDPQSKVYGDPDPEFTYQITSGSLLVSDTFTGTLTRQPGENVGAYAILQGTLALPDYYEITYVGADLTTTPRPVTVTADPQTKTFSAPDPEFTYQITQGSLVFSDTFTGTLTRAPGEAVGTYPILQGSLALTDNYDLTYVGANLTITGVIYYLPLVFR